MGLTIIVGKKGSGKTAFALGQIERELCEGRRVVITNLEIYKDKLERYLRDKGKEVNVADRLVCLGARDTSFRRWWRVRGAGKLYGAFGHDPQWDECEGVFYVVDEGQKHFSARSWTERLKDEPGEVSLGREAEDYLCQERKTGDETLVTTPSSSLLDKQFRTLSTECVVLDNWYKKKFRGIRPPGRFQARVYENCPPGPGEEPTASPKFQLDALGLMSCYNTAAGAGFVGSQADKDQPSKGGVPLWAVIALLPVFGLVVWFGFHYLIKGAVGHFGKKLDGGAVAQAVPVSKPVSQFSSNRTHRISEPPPDNSARPFVVASGGADAAGRDKAVALIRGFVRGTGGLAVDYVEHGVCKVSTIVELPRGDYAIDGQRCRFEARVEKGKQVQGEKKPALVPSRGAVP